jgi:hypothetical protein
MSKTRKTKKGLAKFVFFLMGPGRFARRIYFISLLFMLGSRYNQPVPNKKTA